jgi:acetyltransferase
MSPERAVSALDTLIKYENHKKLKLESIEQTNFSLPESSRLVLDLIRHVRTEKRDPSLMESLKLIESLGIQVPPYREVTNVNQIDSVICELQPPYALKIDVTGLSHKSDIGGVVLNLTASELKSKARGLIDKFISHPGFKGLLIQEMLSNVNQFEMIVGGKRDPHFGSVMVLGYGGVFVELLKKLSIKIAPVSDLDADAMVNELPSSDILSSVRGRMGIDKASLKYSIRALSEIMLSHPEINSIEINPLICSPQGTQAADARIFVQL